MQVLPPRVKLFPRAERVRVCRELADLLPVTFQARDGTGARMLLAVWARAATHFEVVLLIAEQGYGDQVAILARALFEGMIDAYWIAKHPKDAQRLATLHYRHTRLRAAEHWNAHERHDGDPALPLFSEDLVDRTMLNAQFGSKGQRHWTCQSLPDRIAKVDATVPQDHPGELMSRYEADNTLSNLLLHGSAMALNDRISETPFGAHIHVGPSEQHLANALRHAYWSYQRLLLLICERCLPTSSAQAEKLYTEGWPLLQTITEAALKKAGRNSPCPCRSGKKAKDCHGSL